MTYAIRNATDSSGAYTSELALEPALDVLTRCDGLADPPQRRQLVQSLRQVVAHHCMVEAIKRAEVARLARAPQGVYGSGEGQQGGDEVPGEVQQQQENTAGVRPCRCFDNAPLGPCTPCARPCNRWPRI